MDKATLLVRSRLISKQATSGAILLSTVVQKIKANWMHVRFIALSFTSTDWQG